MIQSNAIDSEYDVVVLGGGPAGSSTATFLAQRGVKVALFEREKFPRFHIGESMIPHSYWAFKRLNMLDKLKSSRFVKKYSVRFVNQVGKLSEPFYFIDHRPHESSQTWQVRRSELDQMLIDNAREHGVQVFEGMRAIEVLFDGDQAVGAKLRSEEGEDVTVKAKVVVDACGQSSLILDRMNLRSWDAELRKAAVWTYWKGALRDEGKDDGATIVLQTQGKKGWFWYIPLHDDIVSVGVVAAFDYLFKDRASKDLEKIYFEEVERCPGIQPRIANAERCDIFRAQKEFSYRSTQCAGNGWVLVGDAFGFLDPLYSSGVLLALTSGSMAADAIADGLEAGDTSEAQLRRWETEFIDGMDRMKKLVNVYYDGFSFGRFIRRYPHLKGYVTDVLIGDIFKPELDVLWPLIEEMQAEFAAEKAAQMAAAD